MSAKAYSQPEAREEKSRIEEAFRAGLISYDKKRGLKMLVTKRTTGQVPVQIVEPKPAAKLDVDRTTKIEWCDHTFNPWMGCTKVSPLCDHCYAETLVATRYGWAKWGAPGEGNGTRVRTSPANWRKPVAWDRKAKASGTRPFVFVASLADVFDNAVDPAWRADLFELIRATPHLVYLLLTKRPQNIAKMVAAAGSLPSNVALGASAGTQVEVERNGATMTRLKSEMSPLFVFLSVEPLLEAVDMTRLEAFAQLDWVIVGGESGRKARPMELNWARTIRDQCQAAGVMFNFKQVGARLGHGADTLDGVRHFDRPEINQLGARPSTTPTPKALPLPASLEEEPRAASWREGDKLLPQNCLLVTMPADEVEEYEASLSSMQIAYRKRLKFTAGSIYVFDEQTEYAKGALVARSMVGGVRLAQVNEVTLKCLEYSNRKKHCHSDGQLYERLWNVYNQKVLAELMPRHSPRAHKAWETTCYWRGLVRDGHATLNVRVFFRIKGRNEMVSELAANQQHAKSVAARLVRHVSREHFDGQPIKPQIEFVRIARAA